MIDYSSLEKKKVKLDGDKYKLFVKRNVVEPVSAPRLAIVSYLPAPETADLLRICIRSIEKYTTIPYELWIIDNNSPEENIAWLLDEPKTNLVLNRTQPREVGSYANAIGLEIAAASIDQDSQYLMTLHHDIAACKKGWLEYMLSKFDSETRAVGVRMDTARVKEGILHVLGYIIDFQIFRKLKLDFYPDLPGFDVGDRAIVALRKAGHKIFAAPNSLWQPELIETIPEGSPLRDIPADRSFDDAGDVFFLHLGRGTLKTKGEVEDKKSSLKLWKNTLTAHFI